MTLSARARRGKERVNIWWIPEGKTLRAAEIIDEAKAADAAALVGEYRMAYGGTVWAGARDDCPLVQS